MFPAGGPKIPLGLVEIEWPKDNGYTPAKAELGWLLFFDNRLSSDATVSCANCHAPAHAFSDGQPVSLGIGGQKGKRSARPSSTASTAGCNSGMAGPRPSKIRPRARSPIRSK